MNGVWSLLASVVEALANLGAGMASTGIGYEPELPEELRKYHSSQKGKGRPSSVTHSWGMGPFPL